MAPIAGQQGGDASLTEDIKVSFHDNMQSKDLDSQIGTEFSGVDAIETTSGKDEVDMEEAIETSSEDTPTATSKPLDCDSKPHQVEQKFDDSSKDVADDRKVKVSNSLRPRTDSSLSRGSSEVNWEELQKTEDKHVQEEGSDEAVDFLLARLEQENNALATNPKSAAKRRANRQSRPPSMHHLRLLINGQNVVEETSVTLPSPPPMTELDFWAALVKDYTQTAQRLPTLTTTKIRAGIPPPLRGVAWVSMARARDSSLEDAFDKLINESSPYENIIGKDIGRSFPSVDMFRDANGQGQKMLGKVLKCFSLHDSKIGYCQGLGFLVGSLLMQMGDREAFCVLVRLMEDYDLRSCYLPDLSGLHLRIHQFQQLLEGELPELARHLASLNVEPTYLSQWFLSFFAASCPLHMLFRIFDVIFAEGASETLMRVALAIMRKNQERLLDLREFEDVMRILLSRSLWDPYGCTPTSADDFVNDFTSFKGSITRAKLEELEKSFKEAQESKNPTKAGILPGVQATASRFLGRLWYQSNIPANRTNSLNPGSSAAPRPVSYIRRTASKQSLASTLDSVEGGSDSSARSTSTGLTYDSASSQDSNNDGTGTKTQEPSAAVHNETLTKDRNDDSQIEDLLIALSKMQREHAVVVADLQRERERRTEDNQVINSLIVRLKRDKLQITTGSERRHSYAAHSSHAKDNDNKTQSSEDLDKAIKDIEFKVLHDRRRSQTDETKQQLRESLVKARTETQFEASRAQDLSRRLSEQEQTNAATKEQLREARSRLQDHHKDRQRLEKTIHDLRSGRKGSGGLDMTSVSGITRSFSGDNASGPSPTGLREFKLSRHNSSLSSNATDLSSKQHSPTLQTSSSSRSITPNIHTRSYSRRASSLAAQSVLSTTENHSPIGEDALLLELVNAKTAEATALQELEELKGRFEALKKATGTTTATRAGNAISVTSADGAPLSAVPSRLSTPITPDGTISPLASPGGTLATTIKSAAAGMTAPAPALPPTPPLTSATTPTSAAASGSSSSSSGGAYAFFSGWGRRTMSSSNVGSAPK